MQKKLSVIIPVYNGENYISKCIDSVLNQASIKLDLIELLIINDGSRDGSLTVLRSYEKRYPNLVRLIDQKNVGAAKTRNRGIQLAKGTYTTLLDQDDWIDPDYFTTLLGAISIDKHDVVQSGFKLAGGDGSVKRVVMPIKTEFGKLLAIPAWAKIYNTKFLVKNNITFFENNIGEDSSFTLKVIQAAESYETINYAGYNNYFENENNVTNTLHKGLAKQVNIIALLDEMNKIKTGTERQHALLDYNILRTCVYYLLSYGKHASSERFVEVNNELFGWLSSHLSGIEKNRYIWVKPKGEHASASLGIKLMVILNQLRATRLFAAIYCRKKI